MDFPDFLLQRLGSLLHPKLVTGLSRTTHALSGVQTSFWCTWAGAQPLSTAAGTLRPVEGMHPALAEAVYEWQRLAYRADVDRVQVAYLTQHAAEKTHWHFSPRWSVERVFALFDLVKALSAELGLVDDVLLDVLTLECVDWSEYQWPRNIANELRVDRIGPALLVQVVLMPFGRCRLQNMSLCDMSGILAHLDVHAHRCAFTTINDEDLGSWEVTDCIFHGAIFSTSMVSFAATNCTFHDETLLEPDEFIKLTNCHYVGHIAQRWSQRYLLTDESTRGWINLHDPEDASETVAIVPLPWDGITKPVTRELLCHSTPMRGFAIYGVLVDCGALPMLLVGRYSDTGFLSPDAGPGVPFGLFTMARRTVGTLLWCGHHVRPIIRVFSTNYVTGRLVTYVDMEGIS